VLSEFQKDINDLKDRSYDDHKTLGAKMFTEMRGLARNAIFVLETEIFRPKRNDNQLLLSDKKNAADALARAEPEKYVRRIVDVFRRDWKDLQTQYYKTEFDRFARAYNANSPDWASYVVRISKRELSDLTSFVFNREVKSILSNLESNRIFSVETIVIDGYRPEDGARKEYRIQIRDALRSSFNGLLRSMENLLRGVVQSTYEQAYTRFMGTLKA